MKPYIVGICGGSGSGKTYLVNKLLDTLPAGLVTFISMDNYYLPLDQQETDENGLVNFDHPKSIDLGRMEDHIRRLIKGETIHLKEYTFNNPAAKARDLEYKPAPILLLEGLFIFHPDTLSDLFDLRIFMEADEHIRLARRLVRDRDERGYPMESVLRDYRLFVAPMYDEFIAPVRKKCDFIIPNNHHIEKPLEILSDHLGVIISRL